MRCPAQAQADGGEVEAMHTRRDLMEGAAMAAAVIAAVVTYAILAVHPWPASPLSQFLATFGRASAAVWPMQIVWYLAAVAIVRLALWPVRRSSQLICALVAAYFAWIGIAYFAWQMPSMHYSWLWATVFTLQAVLLVVAGTVRRDLVIRPRWDLSSGLGAVFIAYALIGYPLGRMLGGHVLRTVPVFGVSPCASVIFFFGLLLWAVPPARVSIGTPASPGTGRGGPCPAGGLGTRSATVGLGSRPCQAKPRRPRGSASRKVNDHVIPQLGPDVST